MILFKNLRVLKNTSLRNITAAAIFLGVIVTIHAESQNAKPIGDDPNTVKFLEAEFSSSPRKDVLFNNGWMFHLGDVAGAEALGFDDSGWEKVGLPHSASIPYWIEQIEVYEGDAWYRNHFKVEESLSHHCGFSRS